MRAILARLSEDEYTALCSAIKSSGADGTRIMNMLVIELSRRSAHEFGFWNAVLENHSLEEVWWRERINREIAFVQPIQQRQQTSATTAGEGEGEGVESKGVENDCEGMTTPKTPRRRQDPDLLLNSANKARILLMFSNFQKVNSFIGYVSILIKDRPTKSK